MFTLDPTTSLTAAPGLDGVAGWLRGVLGPATGCWLPGTTVPDANVPGTTTPGTTTPGRTTPGTITPGIGLALDPGLGPEAYRLDVTTDAVTIAGGSPAGVFYGAQTLRQLLPAEGFRAASVGTRPWVVPAVHIVDAPRYGWRGCLLDVARHFLPKADVLRFIDLLALHKLNVLHLHLTDDQGWRLEIPRWPRLVEVGAWRRRSMVGPKRYGAYDARPHGGYYTRSDIAEIVAYAADRYVTVVPEVDLPGHMRAAIAAYPELGNTGARLEVDTDWGISPHVLAVSDTALRFCFEVLDDVCDLFDSPVIGVGGDECPTGEWVASAAAQARAASLGRSPEQLQSWFLTQVAAHLAGRGRRILGWDEILADGAPPGALIAAWRGASATVDAARAGHDVVACPRESVYLDYRQSTDPGEPIPVGPLLTLEDVYRFSPVPAELDEEQASRVVGVQACLWTEHVESARALDYLAFPRLCALAEVAWSGPGHALEDFHGRLRLHKARLRASGVEYRHDNGPLPWQTRPDARGLPR